ncbi:uncharacterized protein TA09500 [Theileria annulata]|uniref:Uncharacterized protein n=1 Tax=Theileria annulata TaxID=5874 RepID=Q4UBX3_THEAN|nr:uncharacterized protein TA09500 [Theileria annulata]CAI75678.1 hypothetical protein TA09500 [Theileria annulata]|eukprot:XP_955154.1 hypothetical protein TA09500 [Theileria annulata]
MTSIITILTITLIECVFGVIYVDLKNFIISNGVNVFHGRFNINSRYFMFVGDSEPISELRYGNEVIFPKENGSQEYNLLVELFIINKVILVSFYVHTFNDGLLKSVNRHTISISSDKYSHISNEEFIYKINRNVLVSFDIGPKPKHPFIKRSISDHVNFQMYRYKFEDKYKGFMLDGKSGPLYRFGYVYDSNRPAVVGYTKRPYLTDECVSIAIYISHPDYNNLFQFIFEPFMIELYGHYIRTYEMRPILGDEYWFLTEYSDVMLSDQMNRNAIRLYMLYRAHNRGLPVITIDISELASPELYGIEKVTGSSNLWNHNYTFYKLKDKFDNEYKIRLIIDSNINNRNIYVPKIKYKHFNIEVYRNEEATYVVISDKDEIMDGIRIKQSRLFKKGVNEKKYNNIKNRERKKIIQKFEKSYPIKLDITIDEEQPSLFEKKEISDGEMTIHHFSIKETNDFGESILNKYVFGAVYATGSFQPGNIPLEPFRKNKVMINPNINTNKFIVRNKSTFDDLNTPQYQLFRLRT